MASSPERFLQLICGFAATDAGYGMIVEALRDRNGEYAPSLEALAKSGRFTAEARRHFQQFVDDLLGPRIVLTGATPGNVLYSYDDDRGQRFVLIDGFGQRGLMQDLWPSLS